MYHEMMMMDVAKSNVATVSRKAVLTAQPSIIRQLDKP
jgi:hypothetical protein